jgi:23S rRNA G2445 N2-methylase RlmL
VLRTLGYQDVIDVQWSDIHSFRPIMGPALVATNPPYGKRIEASKSTYRALGDFLKLQRASVKRACFLASEPTLARAIGLPIAKTIPLKNGGIPVELYWTSFETPFTR